MIKNTSINTEKNITYLRVNLHNPQNSAASQDVIIPPMVGKKAIYIKELTLKSEGNGKNLQSVHAAIRDSLRIMKQKDASEIKSADQRDGDENFAFEKLIPMKPGPNQNMVGLRDIIVRPAITGKKTIGQLECHCNGFRFNSSKGQKVDFTFNNIRNAFFQPSEESDIIVLIHFRLKAAI